MKFCLLVEQSEVIRKIAKRILEDEHFVVLEADVGHLALEMFARGAPDLVLIDWQIKSPGALAVLEQIQPLLDDGKASRIVYCTTEFDSVMISKAMLAGATDVLMKPFTKQMLLAKLQPRQLAA
jgi:two-component system, chemotaxis family, chemotaxis protein CheY